MILVESHARPSRWLESLRVSATTVLRRVLRGGAAASLLALPGAAPGMALRRPVIVRAIVLAGGVRDSMNAIWSRSNAHWNELADQNTLTQMLGTGKPTQREYLGCLSGRVDGDTLRVTATRPARRMRQLQFAVTGTCAGVPGFVATWHTHPWRADTAGRALKERDLSAQDLATFARGSDPAVLVVWDIDSIDAATRTRGGGVRHPAAVVIVGR